MGALANLAQRDRVREAVRALAKNADIVFGDPEHVEVVGADAETGAFMSPVLLIGRSQDFQPRHAWQRSRR